MAPTDAVLLTPGGCMDQLIHYFEFETTLIYKSDYPLPLNHLLLLPVKERKKENHVMKVCRSSG